MHNRDRLLPVKVQHNAKAIEELALSAWSSLAQPNLNISTP
jgi:hypothetical protein